VPATSQSPPPSGARSAAGSGDAAAATRSRQAATERAAEQAAADLALLRTFGFADPSLRPDTAPVVSLVNQHEPAPEPLVPGVSQPVRFRAVRRGGAPAGRVAVTLLDDRGRIVAEDVAGVDGRGEVLAPASGTFVLVCTAPGHQPGATAITVIDGSIDTEVLLVRSASLSGSVHGEDGPIAGARVTLVQDGEIVDSVDTGPDAEYRIEDLAGGEYGLSVVAAGCEPIAILLEVPDEADMRHDVDLEPAGAQAAYNRSDDLAIGQP
jgi:Carboxypeptidase regulatory-like domain